MVFVGRRRPVLGLMAVGAVTGAAVRNNQKPQTVYVQAPPQQQQYQQAPPQQQYQQAPPQQQYQQAPQQQQYQQAPQQKQTREAASQYVSQGPAHQHQGQVTQSTSSVSHVQAAPLISEQTRSAPASQHQSQNAAAPSPPPRKTRGPTSASRAILKVLEETVAGQRLQGFYQTNQLDYISQVIAENQAVSVIGNEWRLEPAVANDLVKLALYDVILYLDDSSSMKSDDGGSKIGDVKYLISSLAYVVGQFNPKGMKLRMINSPLEADNLTNEVVTNDFLSKVRFDGSAPSGKVFEGKVLEPFILGPAREQRLEKPVLVIVVTDRAPGAMVRDKVLRVIKTSSEELGRTRYGSNAVSYQVTAIGDDPKLGKFLAVLDANAEINVDTTAGYETEAINHLAANPPLEISPELWLVKLLLGGIDPTYRNDKIVN